MRSSRTRSGRSDRNRRERLTAVGRLDDPESVGLERLGEHLPQGGLVLDDEDRPCHLRSVSDARVNGPFADGKHRRAGPRPARRAAQRAARAVPATPCSTRRTRRTGRGRRTQRPVVVEQRPKRPVRVEIAALADSRRPLAIERPHVVVRLPRAWLVLLGKQLSTIAARPFTASSHGWNWYSASSVKGRRWRGGRSSSRPRHNGRARLGRPRFASTFLPVQH